MIVIRFINGHVIYYFWAVQRESASSSQLGTGVRAAIRAKPERITVNTSARRFIFYTCSLWRASWLLHSDASTVTQVVFVHRQIDVISNCFGIVFKRPNYEFLKMFEWFAIMKDHVTWGRDLRFKERPLITKPLPRLDLIFLAYCVRKMVHFPRDRLDNGAPGDMESDWRLTSMRATRWHLECQALIFG